MFTGWFRRPQVTDLLNASKSNAAPDYSNRLVSNSNAGAPATDTDVLMPNAKGPSAGGSSLKRVYKLVDLVYLGICNVVGSGIYVLAGTAGKDEAGSGLLLSLVIGLFSAGASALCYAEFASRIPVIGGSYTFIYVSSGEMLGFLTGFVRIITMTCSCAINAIGAAGYLRSFIQSLNNNNNNTNLDDSIWFGSDLYGDIISVNIVAPLIILFFTLIVLYDVKLSASFMNIAATWNILLLIFFICAGLLLFDIDILTSPCTPEIESAFNTECPPDAVNSFFPFGIEGVIMASTITFWSFAGSENVASVAEETINPIVDIPKSIYITLIIVFILFELITLALLGMVPFQALDETAPLAEAFAFHNESTVQQICSFGAFTTMSILLFSKIISAPRYLYRIGVDGLLCKFLAYVHPVRQTPFKAIFIFTVIAMIIATFFDLSSVLSFAATTTLTEYTMVCCGTLIMRYCPPVLDHPIDMDTNNDNDNHIDDSANRGYSFDNIDDNNNNNNNNSKSFIQITAFWTDRKIFGLIWSYFLMCLIIGYCGFNYEYIYHDIELDIVWIVLMIVFGGIILIQMSIIMYLDKILPWKDWIRGGRDAAKHITFVPLSPFIQCILIIINSILIASGGLILLAQVFGLCVCAFIVYISYGFKHSKLGNKYRETLLEMK